MKTCFPWLPIKTPMKFHEVPYCHRLPISSSIGQKPNDANRRFHSFMCRLRFCSPRSILRTGEPTGSLLGTSASLLVTSALLVVTRFATRNKCIAPGLREEVMEFRPRAVPRRNPKATMRRPQLVPTCLLRPVSNTCYWMFLLFDHFWFMLRS